MANKNVNSKPAEEAVDQAAASAPAEKTASKQKLVAKDIDVNQYIPVKNGFNGILVYKSRHTGEEFIWDAIGDEQEIELIELKRAKSASKRFFSDNWFMFDEDYQWVIDYLGVGNYYKNAISMDDIDDVLRKPADELRDALGNMSKGQKKTIAYRARQMIADGEIDSRKSVEVLEDILGTDLVEKL